ncbi:MAG: CehA/McbA family metallohydrolase [Gammaproteobacteria bacterium]|nr:CehA/McbA family metallohydrolase [Gammaproteobacteria bacterium]MDH5303881.1 CehA/McbA family metallohydrolase [Gammaproteobacteria bacterium]MDH5321484.1 CehA/McbA family metallohydrolase [Gammaproteobacteria bacterium]
MTRRILPVALALALLVALAITLRGYKLSSDLKVLVGPTSIPRGNATSASDITVSNRFFAVAFAAETAPPWGVARGGIVDIAIVRDGEIGYDFASLADFMPNRWSSWPTSYQQVSVEKEAPDEVVIRTVRDWGAVRLETRFTIRNDSRRIHLLTRMTNEGENPTGDIFSGYVVWPEGGSLFGVPGMNGAYSGTEENALADWSAAYDENWALGLHAPYSEFADYDGRDRYLQHQLRPGDSREFEAWLQIEAQGSLAEFVRSQIEFEGLPHGRVSGRVAGSDGKLIDRPAVVAMQHGSAYAWTIGRGGAYEFDLPAGEYSIYATARGYAAAASYDVMVSEGSDVRLNFDAVPPPGAVRFRVADAQTGQPLDARIDIQSGYKSLIGFFGRNTLFTELSPKGEVTASMPPGNYVFKVSAAAGFTSLEKLVDVVVVSGGTAELRADIAVMAAPSEHGWYSADLHHHSDVLDGFTEAAYVLRSELAAGVDIAFLSDHDSVINNAEMQLLSAARGVKFMSGTELSPSWAHFNAYPLDEGKEIDIDTGQSSVQEIFAAARRMGADVIAANHPYNGYGYFASLDEGAVPGGYDPGFDLVEIIGGGHDGNIRTLDRVWQMWNEGKRAYFSGGSDAHDVWLEQSGAVRTYVHVDGELSIEKYVSSLRAGHAYASQGPLVYPEILFGSDITHARGNELVLAYTVQAVSGLLSVRLIERGSEIQTRSFEQLATPVAVDFTVNPDADTWYSLVIEDEQGKFAYTNPVWVTVSE